MDQTAPPHRTVVDAIRAAIPATVALAGGSIRDVPPSPFAEETQAVTRAVEKRRREFFAGRHYARAAMAQLGVNRLPIAVLPSRAPDWPSGLTGSISHCQDVCVAAVASKTSFAGVGIDIELSVPLAVDLYATVLDPVELEASRLPPFDVDLAKLLFVVKESFFKLYHPLTGHFLDFTDVSVRVDPARRTFNVALKEGAPSLLGMRTFDGVWGRADAYCFAFVALKC